MAYALPNQRPRASVSYLASYRSNDPFYTRSEIAIEYCTCDNYKVILLMCEQLMFLDRMQKQDIIAIVRQDLKTACGVEFPVYRPEAPDSWWDAWTSDDFYTQTSTQLEHFAADSFKVIRLMCLQIRHFDRLTDDAILAVIEEDIDRHFLEEDVA